MSKEDTSSREEVPFSSEETAPSVSEDNRQPGQEGEAPLLEEEITHLSGEEVPTYTEFSEEGSTVPFKKVSASDYLNLLPSDEKLVVSENDDGDLSSFKVRARPTPRLAQSMLSEVVSQSSHRSSKYRRSVSGLTNVQETLKEKQVCLIKIFRVPHYNFK